MTDHKDIDPDESQTLYEKRKTHPFWAAYADANHPMHGLLQSLVFLVAFVTLAGIFSATTAENFNESERNMLILLTLGGGGTVALGLKAKKAVRDWLLSDEDKS